MSKILTESLQRFRKAWQLGLWNVLQDRMNRTRVASTLNKSYSSLTLRETFEQIYQQQTWGGSESDPVCSGLGSRGELRESYVSLIGPEVKRRQVRSLVDLGCGDFWVGSRLAVFVDDYTGVDIADAVVSRNQGLHGNPHVRFLRADLTRDPLPAADAAVLRQVLQHLSNQEIKLALQNVLKTYRIVFITEHLNIGARSRPNLDLPHGPAVRAMKESGVFIDRSPFDVPAKLLADIPYLPDEVLRTWVVERV